MKRRKITAGFVAKLAGVDLRTVTYCIREGIFPYCEFAEAFKLPDAAYYSYSISPEKLREHFPYTDEDLSAFYGSKQAV